MNKTDKIYKGCPVQHARHFIAGKWQLGILWNLKNKPLRFSEIKKLLPGLSDKILMEELDFFIQKKIIERKTYETPIFKSEYQFSTTGQSLIPVIDAIIQWGYCHLQDEKVSNDMNITPLSAIENIENSISKK